MLMCRSLEADWRLVVYSLAIHCGNSRDTAVQVFVGDLRFGSVWQHTVADARGLNKVIPSNFFVSRRTANDSGDH